MHGLLDVGAPSAVAAPSLWFPFWHFICIDARASAAEFSWLTGGSRVACNMKAAHQPQRPLNMARNACQTFVSHLGFAISCLEAFDLLLPAFPLPLLKSHWLRRAEVIRLFHNGRCRVSKVGHLLYARSFPLSVSFF